MSVWWDSLTNFQQILAIIGTAATAVLLIQLILSVFGLFGSTDVSDGVDTDDFDADGLAGIDLDGDGIPDFDFDGDGLPDIDLDGDGIPDVSSAHFSGDAHDNSFHKGDSPHSLDIDASNLAFGFSDILSFRGIVTFFAIFSWLSLALTEHNVNFILSIIIGFICGFAVMVLLGYLFYRLKIANYSGTLDPHNAIGLTGYVYLRIPANETGTGKLQITVQSRYAELSAVTRWPQEIPTGENARVVSVRKDGTLVVEPTTVSKDIELRL